MHADQKTKRPRGRPVKMDWNSLIIQWKSLNKAGTVNGVDLALKDFCKQNQIAERTFRYHRNKATSTKVVTKVTSAGLDKTNITDDFNLPEVGLSIPWT